MSSSGRVMVIGAHPDDADFRMGGTAQLWVQAGFEVRFVSATNGDAGHHLQGGGQLARRRQEEARRAGELIGIEYRLLDNHDAELLPTLENRWKLITLIREYRPDLLVSHRPWDYHPDHRYTSVLVQDASFLLTVPNVCALTPALDTMPVIMYCEDGFQKPAPFAPDIAIAIDETMDLKRAMLHEHESQLYEWLSRFRDVPTDETERRAFSGKSVDERSRRTAERFRDKLIELYGPERGPTVEYAEALELCEYGAPLTDEARARLFPFVG